MHPAPQPAGSGEAEGADRPLPPGGGPRGRRCRGGPGGRPRSGGRGGSGRRRGVGAGAPVASGRAEGEGGRPDAPVGGVPRPPPPGPRGPPQHLLPRAAGADRGGAAGPAGRRRGAGGPGGGVGRVLGEAPGPVAAGPRRGLPSPRRPPLGVAAVGGGVGDRWGRGGGAGGGPGGRQPRPGRRPGGGGVDVALGQDPGGAGLRARGPGEVRAGGPDVRGGSLAGEPRGTADRGLGLRAGGPGPPPAGPLL